MDIDRLHSVKAGRRSGRTTDMLVEALQLSDFIQGEQSVAVVCATTALAHNFFVEALRIALEMEFNVSSSWIGLRRRAGFRIGMTTYEFLGDCQHLEGRSDYAVLRDHYKGIKV